MLSDSAAVEITKGLVSDWQRERQVLDRIDWWCRWRLEDIKLPRKATRELRELAELSKTPWLGLVVTTVAQCMYVDGYHSPVDSPGTKEPVRGPWRIWLANRMDARQIAVHRAALQYGYSFLTVLPGNPTSVMRGVSPRRMWAAYEDPAEDDWPRYAIRVDPLSRDSYGIRLYDDEAIYSLAADASGTEVHFVDMLGLHHAGVCPIVRYCNMLDLEGRSPGEVEPYIGPAARINKTAFDRLVTQHFSSWKVRTVTGMAKPDDEEEARQESLRLRQEDLLVAEDPDTRFGTLDATDLRGFIDGWRADIEALAAVTQTPTHSLTGQLVNLNAEALAAARATLTQKVHERKTAFGASHAQGLRLAAALDGDDDYATDVMGRVSWQDTEIRSMSQAVDALGKAATMLHIPEQALWGRIPGVQQSDVDEWVELAREGDPMVALTAELTRQALPA